MDLGERRVEEFLLLLAELGNHISAQLREVVADPHLVENISITLLCRLDLHGPMRPKQIMGAVGLSSGGTTKLIDRMEKAGLVSRDPNGVPADARSVLVELTPEGRRVVREMARHLDRSLPQAEHLVKELTAVMP